MMWLMSTKWKSDNRNGVFTCCIPSANTWGASLGHMSRMCTKETVEAKIICHLVKDCNSIDKLVDSLGRVESWSTVR